MTKVKIKTKGMHCASCEMLIQDALGELDGVARAEASHESGIVNVEFDESKIDVGKIKTVIGNEGYKVE